MEVAIIYYPAYEGMPSEKVKSGFPLLIFLTNFLIASSPLRNLIWSKYIPGLKFAMGI